MGYIEEIYITLNMCQQQIANIQDNQTTLFLVVYKTYILYNTQHALCDIPTCRNTLKLFQTVVGYIIYKQHIDNPQYLYYIIYQPLLPLNFIIAGDFNIPYGNASSDAVASGYAVADPRGGGGGFNPPPLRKKSSPYLEGFI